MGSIAEALVATAVGLLVAIPAVVAFNALQARVSAAIADAQTLGHVLLAHLRASASPEGDDQEPLLAPSARARAATRDKES